MKYLLKLFSRKEFRILCESIYLGEKALKEKHKYFCLSLFNFLLRRKTKQNIMLIYCI